MPSFAVIGRVCLGVAVASSGLMQFVNRDFVRLVPQLPAWVPAPAIWPVVIGTLLLAVGLAFVTNRKAGAAAGLLVALLLASFVVQRIPEIAANPGAGFVWTNPAKVLALAGGALLLARGAGMVTVAALALAVFLVLGGVQHFVYAGFVDGLVPAWLPPSQRFWTIFAAVALLAGGVGLAIPRTRRLAALWTGIMIFLWVPLVHLALAFEKQNAFELAGVFEALAIGGVAWCIADATQWEAGRSGSGDSSQPTRNS